MNDQPAPSPGAPARLLTIPEVALASGLSQKSIRRAIERGDLRAMKICNRMRIAREDMAAWHARSTVQIDVAQIRQSPPQPQHQTSRRTRRTPDPVAGGLRELLGESPKESAA